MLSWARKRRIVASADPEEIHLPSHERLLDILKRGTGGDIEHPDRSRACRVLTLERAPQALTIYDGVLDSP